MAELPGTLSMSSNKIRCNTRACGRHVAPVSEWYQYEYGVYCKAYCDHCMMDYWLYRRGQGKLQLRDRREDSFDQRKGPR